MDRLLRYIWLSLACTAGSMTFRKLLDKFEEPADIYQLSEEEIISAVGTKTADYKALADKDLSRAKEILDFCTAKNVGMLPYFSEKYPRLLREIKNPPVLLYYRGTLPNFEEIFPIAVVGTRSLTQYGAKNTFAIAYNLARAGATVVSGMAIGVDGVAHASALSAGGFTVAILGSGIDVCYPPHHKELARKIVKNGCVMTEFAPGTRPNKFNFPKRNRIISGLSHATLLIEGGVHSGALITARNAEQQGRAVYAVPGNVGNRNSEASNILIKSGAHLCTSAEDIISDFDKSAEGLLNPFAAGLPISKSADDVISEYGVYCMSTGSRRNDVPMNIEDIPEFDCVTAKASQINQQENDDREKRLSSFDKKAIYIYKKIPCEGECTVDSLLDGENSLRDIMSALLKLEMGGFVTTLPGDRVKRNL